MNNLYRLRIFTEQKKVRAVCYDAYGNTIKKLEPTLFLFELIEKIEKYNTAKKMREYSVFSDKEIILLAPEIIQQIVDIDIPCDKKFLYLLKDLQNIVEDFNKFKFENIEVLRTYYSINSKMNIYINANNIFEPMNINQSEEFQVKFDYINFDSKYKFDEMKEYEKEYVYECTDMADIIFALIHYLKLNKYIFRVCEHCGKKFASKSYQVKYCSRISPLSDSEKPEICSKKVKDMQTLIDKTYVRLLEKVSRKESIENKFNTEYKDIVSMYKSENYFVDLNEKLKFLRKKKKEVDNVLNHHRK